MKKPALPKTYPWHHHAEARYGPGEPIYLKGKLRWLPSQAPMFGQLAPGCQFTWVYDKGVCTRLGPWCYADSTGRIVFAGPSVDGPVVVVPFEKSWKLLIGWAILATFILAWLLTR